LTNFAAGQYLIRLKNLTWRKRLLESTRGQILQLLHQQDCTVDELAKELRLTDNAIRANLASLQDDGFVIQSGTRPGSRKPHTLYGVTPAVEQLFPKAYGRLLDLALGAIRRRLASRQLRQAMREVGRKIAAETPANARGRSRQQRIDAAIRILSELGGEPIFEQVKGTEVIRSRGCPIAAATANHPEACLIAESLLAKVIGSRVREHCRRGPQPSCCFEIS
jgi:predicted ArsR family transcriptional regulator